MKNFISLPDIFADIFNAVLFQGEDVLEARELKNVKNEYSFIFEAPSQNVKNKRKSKRTNKKKSIQNFRDVVKETLNGCTFSIILGIENQNDVDHTMAQRVMLYDALEYERQIRIIKARNETENVHVPKTQRIGSEQKLLPVISIVIYTGTEPWTGPKCLYDMLKLPSEKQEKLLPYINDYAIHVIDLRHLSQDEIAYFSSDFRLLAETLNEILPQKAAVHHDELVNVLSFLRNDTRYLELKDMEDGKEGDSMSCALLDAAIEKGRRYGLEEGWKILILNNLEENIPKERTLNKLQTRFCLSKEDAEKEYDRIVNQEK